MDDYDRRCDFELEGVVPLLGTSPCRLSLEANTGSRNEGQLVES